MSIRKHTPDLVQLQNRHPSGAPASIGGQWTFGFHTESRGGTDLLTPQVEVLSVDQARELAQKVGILYAATHGVARGRQEAATERMAALQRELGTREAWETHVRAVGNAIAVEAEARAGVDTTEMARAAAARRANAEAVAVQLQERAQPGLLALRERFVAEYEAPYTEALRTRAGLSPDQRRDIEDRHWRGHLDYVEAREVLLAPARHAARVAAGAMTEEEHEALDRLRDAYLEVLSEIRPVGGDLTFHSKTSRQAQESFNTAARFYPTDWVESSNSSRTGLLAKVSSRRAHYSPGHHQQTRKRVQDSSWCEPDSYQVRNAEDGDPRYSIEAVEDPAYVEMVKIARWETYSAHSGETLPRQPRGRGWVEYRWEKPTGTVEVGWRRPLTSLKTVSSEHVGEILTDTSAATSVHELAHRFEDTVPTLKAMERDFLARRTTGPDGKPEGLIPLYPGKRQRGGREMARKDRFTNAYIGKEYESGFTEVTSMGAESLFARSCGGLVGAGHHSPDHDLRAFVLGALATART